MHSIIQRVDAHPALVLVSFYAVSRVLFFAGGGHFDTAALSTHWQILDPAILESHPLRGLWNLHMQPPGLNALVALTLQLRSPGAQTAVLWGCFAAATGFATAMIYRLVARLSASSGWALLAASVYVVSPETLLFENYLFYPHLSAAMLAGFMLLGLEARRSGLSRMAGWAVALGVGLCLTYGLFHAVWFAVVLLLLFARSARPVHVIALVGLGLVGSLYLKNFVQFGVVGPSSWTGMNLALTTHSRATAERLAEILGPGTIGSHTGYVPFAKLAEYPSGLVEAEPGPPELSDPLRSDGRNNYNHTAYIRLGSLYAGEWATIVRKAPALYLSGVVSASYGMFFRTSTSYGLLDENRAAIDGYVRVVDRLFGRLATEEPEVDTHASFMERLRARIVTVPWLLPILLVGCLLIGARRVLAAGPDLGWNTAVLFTLLWVFLVPLVVNASESERIRVGIGPLLFVLFFSETARRWQKRFSSTTPK